MSSDQIIHHMGCDISELICDYVPDWPFPDEPGDTYFDMVTAVFGETPSLESMLITYRNGNAGKVLMDVLNKEGETNVVKEKAAKRLLKHLVSRFLGMDAVK